MNFDFLPTMYFFPVNADAVLKGTNVNGVFDCHPRNDNITLDHISFREVVSRGVTSMDMMALAYCEENGIPGLYFLTVFIQCNRPKILFSEVFFLPSCSLQRA